MTDHAYLEALELHQTGHLEEAEHAYKWILKSDPRNADVLHLMSILYAQQHEFVLAQDYMRQALAEKPDSASYNNSMGNILKNLEDYATAIKYFKEALRLEPNYAVAHNNIANVFYKLKDLKAAKKHYARAVHINPKYADAHYNLALVLQHLGEIAEAEQHFLTTIQLQPKHTNALYRLAFLLQTRNDLGQAARYYQKALRIDPKDAGSHHNLGAILVSKKKYAAAIAHFKKALLLQPDNLEALNNLGSIYLLQKNPTLALKYFFILAQKTHDYNAYFNLGVIYMDLGRIDDAIIYLTEALKIKPGDFAAYSNLGSIFLRREDYVNAQACYEKALALKPDNQEIIYLLAAITEQQEPTTAPREYVESLFDQYASYYEKHLSFLGYKVPELLFAAVSNYTNLAERKLNILDLGCGPGTVGVTFKAITNKIIGVDLSEKMLDLAQQKGIYSELKHLSIEDALEFYHDLDLVIAADVLVYLGDLTNIFAKAKQSLVKDGVFAFTVEKIATYPYILQRTARFAHSLQYINELIKKNGFSLLRCDEIVLRAHQKTIIEGYLFLLKS